MVRQDREQRSTLAQPHGRLPVRLSVRAEVCRAQRQQQVEHAEAKHDGLRTFDAWAHHPYYGNPSSTPATKKVGPRAVELGNIDKLIGQVTKLYGRKPMWITEYGYQTRPPDQFFGVSWAKQAQYLQQAYDIARANPRIDLFTWFLLDDSADPDGWQSGLITVKGKHKPAFAVFEHLRDQAV